MADYKTTDETRALLGVDVLERIVDALTTASALGYPVFDSVADGLAAAASGGGFSVRSGADLVLYRDGGGAAVEVARLPLKAAIDAQDERLAALETLGAAGMTPKAAVVCATTANITLSGEQTIDGVTTAGSRVLVKNQTTAAQNGIYVSAPGAWTRATDMDAAAEFAKASVYVTGGTVNGGRTYYTSSVVATVGTDPVTWLLAADQSPVQSQLSTVQAARYGERGSPNAVLSPGNTGPTGWRRSGILNSFASVVAASGRKALRVDAPSARQVWWDARVPAGAAKLSYAVTLEDKTAASGRVLILQYNADGSSTSGGTEVARQTLTFPSGAVSSPSQYAGTVDIAAGAVRVVMWVDTQGAGVLTFSEAMLAFDADKAGYRAPEPLDYRLARAERQAGFGNVRVGAFQRTATGAVYYEMPWHFDSAGHLYYNNPQAVLATAPLGISYTGEAAEYTLDASYTDSNGNGAILTIGTPGAAMRAFAYLGNGYVGEVDPATTGGAGLTGGAVSGMSYSAWAVARLRLVCYGDGTGFIEAISPGGAKARHALTGLVAGQIGVAVRQLGIARVRGFSAQPLSGDHKTLVEAASTTIPNAATLRGFTLLPDASANRSPKGFTSTGLDRITRGKWAGCWIVADDGRMVEGDGSPLNGQVHVLTPDFGAILATFNFGLVASAQGVAVDTSGSADTFWVALSTDKTVRHYGLDGVEITGDRIDWAALGYTGDPNGVAYDPTNDALFVSTSSTATLRRLSCNPAASPRLIDSFTVETGMDQLHYDVGRQDLYYSKGGNGTDGSVGVLRVSTSTVGSAYGPLPRAQSIEGIYIDRDNAELIVTNDGGFHDAASPALNIALRYGITLRSS